MKLCLPVSLHGAEGMLIQLSLDSVECTGASSVRRMAGSIYCRIRSLFRAKSIELICNAYIAQGRVEKAIRHFAFVVVTHGEQTKYHKPNERQEKWMYTFPCLEDFSLFTARRTGQSKREWFFAFFFPPCFDQICLLPKESQVQTTTDAFASGVGCGLQIADFTWSLGWGVRRVRFTRVVWRLRCELGSTSTVLMRAQQRFNLSYENICTRLAATDVIELKSGWQSHVEPRA